MRVTIQLSDAEKIESLNPCRSRLSTQEAGTIEQRESAAEFAPCCRREGKTHAEQVGESEQVRRGAARFQFDLDLAISVGEAARPGSAEAHVVECKFCERRGFALLAHLHGAASAVHVGNENRIEGLSRNQDGELGDKWTRKEREREGRRSWQPDGQFRSCVDHAVFPTAPFDRGFPAGAVATQAQGYSVTSQSELSRVEIPGMEPHSLPRPEVVGPEILESGDGAEERQPWG